MTVTPPDKHIETPAPVRDAALVPAAHRLAAKLDAAIIRFRKRDRRFGVARD